MAQRFSHVRAVQLLLVDAFADVPECFHARLRGRAGAGDCRGWDEQHDAQGTGGVDRAGQCCRLIALAGHGERPVGGDTRGELTTDRAGETVRPSEQQHLRARDLVDDLQEGAVGLG